MIVKKILLILFLALILFISCNSFHSTGEKRLDNESYSLEKDWPEFPGNFKLGNPTGIGIDSNENIFIFQRANREWPLIGSMPKTYISSKTILMLDRKNGKILSSWGDNIFIMPHGLTVDNNNNIWVTDVGLNQVFEFTHEGKLLIKLGEAGVAGDDSTHFNRPTDVAVEQNGSFYVTDGYGNSRVIKFSSTGKFLFQWGRKGKNEGQFNIPHAITLDTKGNVYVADRENCRIQVFDSTGKFITQWTNENFGHICSLTYDKNTKSFIAVDDATSFFGLKHNGSDVIIMDSTEKVLRRFGRSGSYLGPKCWYHDLAVDNQGNIYVEDILGNTIQKFRKKANHRDNE